MIAARRRRRRRDASPSTPSSEVDICGNFLGQRHTRRHMKDVWRPRLLDRSMWDAWIASGREGAYEKATDARRTAARRATRSCRSATRSAARWRASSPRPACNSSVCSDDFVAGLRRRREGAIDRMREAATASRGGDRRMTRLQGHPALQGRDRRASGTTTAGSCATGSPPPTISPRCSTSTRKQRADLDACMGKFRVSVTPYYASLMDPDDVGDPVRMQAVPDARRARRARRGPQGRRQRGLRLADAAHHAPLPGPRPVRGHRDVLACTAATAPAAVSWAAPRRW